jgi:hypothetical protein
MMALARWGEMLRDRLGTQPYLWVESLADMVQNFTEWWNHSCARLRKHVTQKRLVKHGKSLALGCLVLFCCC